MKKYKDLVEVERSPDKSYIRYDKKIGFGAYKNVYLGYDTDRGIDVAWNVISLQSLPQKEHERISQETQILKNLQHPNIIDFYHVWENEKDNSIVFTTEIVSSGTLKKFAKRSKDRPKLKVIKKWCRQILEVLKYLHTRNPPVIHRDLKCDNIFINGNTGELKVGDLGLSTAKNSPVKTVLGTPEFMAPEMYDEKYDEMVDIYAFGMCVLELCTNEYPYQECLNPAQIYKKVISGEKPRVLSRIVDMKTRWFIEQCITVVHERLNSIELLEHPFLRFDSLNDVYAVEMESPETEKVNNSQPPETVTKGILCPLDKTIPNPRSHKEAKTQNSVKNTKSIFVDFDPEKEKQTFEDYANFFKENSSKNVDKCLKKKQTLPMKNPVTSDFEKDLKLVVGRKTSPQESYDTELDADDENEELAKNYRKKNALNINDRFNEINGVKKGNDSIGKTKGVNKKHHQSNSDTSENDSEESDHSEVEENIYSEKSRSQSLEEDEDSLYYERDEMKEKEESEEENDGEENDEEEKKDYSEEALSGEFAYKDIKREAKKEFKKEFQVENRKKAKNSIIKENKKTPKKKKTKKLNQERIIELLERKKVVNSKRNKKSASEGATREGDESGRAQSEEETLFENNSAETTYENYSEIDEKDRNVEDDRKIKVIDKAILNDKTFGSSKENDAKSKHKSISSAQETSEEIVFSEDEEFFEKEKIKNKEIVSSQKTEVAKKNAKKIFHLVEEPEIKTLNYRAGKTDVLLKLTFDDVKRRNIKFPFDFRKDTIEQITKEMHFDLNLSKEDCEKISLHLKMALQNLLKREERNNKKFQKIENQKIKKKFKTEIQAKKLKEESRLLPRKNEAKRSDKSRHLNVTSKRREAKKIVKKYDEEGSFSEKETDEDRAVNEEKISREATGAKEEKKIKETSKDVKTENNIGRTHRGKISKEKVEKSSREDEKILKKVVEPELAMKGAKEKRESSKENEKKLIKNRKLVTERKKSTKGIRIAEKDGESEYAFAAIRTDEIKGSATKGEEDVIMRADKGEFKTKVVEHTASKGKGETTQKEIEKRTEKGQRGRRTKKNGEEKERRREALIEGIKESSEKITRRFRKKAQTVEKEKRLNTLYKTLNEKERLNDLLRRDLNQKMLLFYNSFSTFSTLQLLKQFTNPPKLKRNVSFSDFDYLRKKLFKEKIYQSLSEINDDYEMFEREYSSPLIAFVPNKKSLITEESNVINKRNLDVLDHNINEYLKLIERQKKELEKLKTLVKDVYPFCESNSFKADSFVSSLPFSMKHSTKQPSISDVNDLLCQIQLKSDQPGLAVIPRLNLLNLTKNEGISENLSEFVSTPDCIDNLSDYTENAFQNISEVERSLRNFHSSRASKRMKDKFSTRTAEAMKAGLEMEAKSFTEDKTMFASDGTMKEQEANFKEKSLFDVKEVIARETPKNVAEEAEMRLMDPILNFKKKKSLLMSSNIVVSTGGIIDDGGESDGRKSLDELDAIANTGVKEGTSKKKSSQENNLDIKKDGDKRKDDGFAV